MLCTAFCFSLFQTIYYAQTKLWSSGLLKAKTDGAHAVDPAIGPWKANICRNLLYIHYHQIFSQWNGSLSTARLS